MIVLVTDSNSQIPAGLVDRYGVVGRSVGAHTGPGPVGAMYTPAPLRLSAR